ncbi:PIN domain-containing protein [Lichenicoccus sp.]|uniref:PIN domain-containing protein n=1 Tax=Lichenicoccus sp. TaxID=2781899 RepID=UPI003D0FBF0D
MPGSFFDTNVLVYLASGDAEKADGAEAVVAAGGAISVQVLNEFTNVARRKMRMSWSETNAFLTTLRGLLTVHPLTVEIHDNGLALAERHGFSVYDAMIVASAVHADCHTLWSEDMQHGLFVQDGLRIINPFRNDDQPMHLHEPQALFD